MVVLYSTGCPKCKVLEGKMDEKHIHYEVNTSVEDMCELGIMQAPMLCVDGKLLAFIDANEWVNKQNQAEA